MGVSVKGGAARSSLAGLAMSIRSALKTKNGTLSFLLAKARGIVPDELITRRAGSAPVDEPFERFSVRPSLSCGACADTDLLDPGEVSRVMQTADGAKRWYLLNLAMWWRTFIAKDVPAPPVAALA